MLHFSLYNPSSVWSGKATAVAYQTSEWNSSFSWEGCGSGHGDMLLPKPNKAAKPLLSAEPGLQPSKVMLTRGILQHQSRLSCAGKWELTKQFSNPLLISTHWSQTLGISFPNLWVLTRPEQSQILPSWMTVEIAERNEVIMRSLGRCR